MNFLDTLYAPAGTVLHGALVETRLEELLQFRREMIEPCARWQVSQSSEWTQRDWETWYEDHAFSHEQMTWVLDQWRARFEEEHMHEAKRAELEKLLSEDTRASKTKARDAARKAFRAWMAQRYGHATLAKCILKEIESKLFCHQCLEPGGRGGVSLDHSPANILAALGRSFQPSASFLSAFGPL